MSAEIVEEFEGFADGESTSPNLDQPAFDFGGMSADEAPPIIEPDSKAGREASAERKRERPRTPPKAPANSKPYRKGQFVEPLTNLYGFGAMGLMPIAPHTAEIVGMSAENCAKAWDKLAEDNLAIRRLLQSLTQSSAWGGVLAAHMPIIMAVAIERGVTLPGPLGMMQAAQMTQAETVRQEASE